MRASHTRRERETRPDRRAATCKTRAGHPCAGGRNWRGLLNAALLDRPPGVHRRSCAACRKVTVSDRRGSVARRRRRRRGAGPGRSPNGCCASRRSSARRAARDGTSLRSSASFSSMTRRTDRRRAPATTDRAARARAGSAIRESARASSSANGRAGIPHTSGTHHRPADASRKGRPVNGSVSASSARDTLSGEPARRREVASARVEETPTARARRSSRPDRGERACSPHTPSAREVLTASDSVAAVREDPRAKGPRTGVARRRSARRPRRRADSREG